MSYNVITIHHCEMKACDPVEATSLYDTNLVLTKEKHFIHDVAEKNSTCNRKPKQQCLRLVEVTVTMEMLKSVNVRLLIENKTSETMGAVIAVRRSKVY